MLDLGSGPSDDSSLLVLVDRLAAAGADPAAARAVERVRGAVDAGAPPAGLRHIAEGLTAGATGDASARRSADDAGEVVAAVRDHPLLVLEGVAPEEVATTVTALVDDSRRVIVTAADTAALDAVRAALPAAMRDRVVDALPTLAPADLHRLRGLLARSTPARRARPAQQLPDPARLPDGAEVAELCAIARRPGPPGAELIADVLAELDDERRGAVTAIAGCVNRSLSMLAARDEPGTWELLGDLVHGRRRGPFERLVQSTAHALATIEEFRDNLPVRVLAPLPPGAIDTLDSYLEFREAGGRARSYFRSAVQREVEPVLRLLQVGGRQPDSADDLRVVLAHFELGERLATVDDDCAAVGMSPPRNAGELATLSAALVAVAAAARSVGALRHDVLFLHPGSPLAVPDVAAARQFADAVLHYVENGSAPHATARLDGMADAVAALAPAEATAPEHERAVAALRARNAAGYAAAVDELIGAQHELRDEQRTAALLAELGSSSLAQAWTPVDGNGAARTGLVWLTPVDQLLEELPPPDRADVVVVLDAGHLGVDRALLAAAAPRVVAAAAPGTPADGATLLGLLQEASAPVVRGRAAEPDERVVALSTGALPVALADRGEVQQAGA
jgi:hypothetical protein